MRDLAGQPSKTANYGFPLFLGTDKPNLRDKFDVAMIDIDIELRDLQTQVTELRNEITAMKGKVG